MPRPQRIEYEGAYYHVMNRGRGRQRIFHSSEYYDAFLATVAEAHGRFNVEVLCYCLMGNHYHLLVKTPEANLGRVMRHINGVYTQRYNRLKKTDGPLFRGRYKAISVEEDSYQLQLSRYIHRNPIEAKMVSRLEDYPWSSYRYYVGREKPPHWLKLGDVYAQLNLTKGRKSGYRSYVEQGVDDETRAFFAKGNVASFIGGKAFRNFLNSRKKEQGDNVSRSQRQALQPSLEELIEWVAKQFDVQPGIILNAPRGKVPMNLPRWVYMHLARGYGGYKLREIADSLGLRTTGTIGATIGKLRDAMDDDQKIRRKVEKIINDYRT